jgi:3-methyladenine DNA glycosylase AlkD
MDAWAKDFDSWAVCDGVCLHLFVDTSHAWKKVEKWSTNRREFVRRAAFALMACLAVHDENAPDTRYLRCFRPIRAAATDDRIYVRKAVNWALRQIGKRNRALNRKAIQAARDIRRIDSPAARWIAGDALRELTGAAVQKRLTR